MVDANGTDLLPLDDAAKFLGISKPTIYRLLSSSHLRGVKVGRQWRFRKSDLTAYMERSAVAVLLPRSADLEPEIEFFEAELRKVGVEPTDSDTIPEETAAGTENDEISEARMQGENQVRRLLQRMIEFSVSQRASDIHLEPHRIDGALVLVMRCRIDGGLHEIRRIPNSIREALMLQIKESARMQTERGVAQDGRILTKVADKEFDLRVALAPTHYGEMAVIRVLDRSFTLQPLSAYIRHPESLSSVQSLIHRPNGMIVFTGPAGCGKTVSLYACLREIAGSSVKTITIEDPIEYLLDNVEQIQCSARNGVTFSSALRTTMRLDPDIVYVGELRDQDTASLAAMASLTGHMVLTAMHANDATSAALRLVSIGVQPHIVASTLVGVVSQRLARAICENCKREVPAGKFDKSLRDHVGKMAAEGNYAVPDDAVYYEGEGCEQCRGKGYHGRVAIYEILQIDDALCSAILRDASQEEFEAVALQSGMQTLFADGMRNAVEGIATLDEILRVTYKAF